MSEKKQNKQPISRRQFVQRGAAAAMGFLLAACRLDSTTEAPAPPQAAAQNPPTDTPVPPTATPPPVEATIPPTQTEPAEAAVLPTEEPTPAPTGTPILEPTPQCDDHNETSAQTAGPFYTPDSPERTSLLEAGITGTKLVVSGRVMTPGCEPLAGAILDFWQADDNGDYDNVGYRLRGHQFTDGNGNYRLETIVPGLYPGRTRHIHVIVQGPNTSLLTTQLYFPNEARNQSDGIFHPALVMEVSDSADGQVAAFDFVLA